MTNIFFTVFMPNTSIQSFKTIINPGDIHNVLLHLLLLNTVIKELNYIDVRRLIQVLKGIIEYFVQKNQILFVLEVL